MARVGRAWMTFIVELAFERGHTYVDDAVDVAVAWIPPDLSLVGPDDVVRGRGIIAEHSGEARADEAVATIMAARARALDVPHWTPQYLGVRPARQGAGLGSAAVAPMLRVCDDEGLPCVLVSTSPRNLPFHERLGFRVDGEVATADGPPSCARCTGSPPFADVARPLTWSVGRRRPAEQEGEG